MSAPNDGGPAFPCETYGLRNGKETTIPTNGMSLRDWFAGQALAGIMTRAGSHAFEWAPEIAYTVSDAMIAARNKEAAK